MALTDKLTDIADAIREKGGTTAKLTLAEMPSAIQEIGEESIRLIPGQTLHVQVVLTTKDGSLYTMQDGDTLSLHLWHGASTLDASSTTVELSVDIPGGAIVGRWHWTLTLASGDAEYLAAMEDCNCTTEAAAKLAVVHGLVDESQKWSSSSYTSATNSVYGCKSETTVPPGEYAHRFSLVRCVRLPKITSLSDRCIFYGCRALKSLELPSCTSIGPNVFNYCESLSTLELPSCETIGSYGLQHLPSLLSIELPKVTSLGTSALYGAWQLASLELPACTTLSATCLRDCYSLSKLELPKVTKIGDGVFQYCLSLRVLVFPDSVTIPTCGAGILFGCPCFNTGGVGRIYVADSLVETYKSATNWSTYADFIKPISEWDGTVPELPTSATTSVAAINADDEA